MYSLDETRFKLPFNTFNTNQYIITICSRGFVASVKKLTISIILWSLTCNHFKDLNPTVHTKSHSPAYESWVNSSAKCVGLFDHTWPKICLGLRKQSLDKWNKLLNWAEIVTNISVTQISFFQINMFVIYCSN